MCLSPVQMTAQKPASSPSSFVFPVHTTFMPESISNRRMDYLSDATAVGWNPALLGMRPHFDMNIAGSFSSGGVQTTTKYGVFAKAFGFGIGYASNPAFKPSSGEFYAGYGMQIVDDVLWGGVSARINLFSSPSTDFNVSFTAKPTTGLYVSASATSMTMRKYQEFDNQPIVNEASQVSYNIAASYAVAPELTLLTSLRSRALGQPERVSVDVGASCSLLDAAVVLSGNISMTKANLAEVALRFGVEINSAILDLGYSGRALENVPFESTIFLRISSDNLHAIGQLGEKRTDADLCFGALNPALENPIGLLSALPRLNPLFAETFADNGFANDSAAFYTTIRQRLYARQAGEKALSDNALFVAVKSGYGVELKKNDVSKFPRISTIVRVSDSLGRPVDGLSQADFTLNESVLQKLPRRIVSVQRLDTTVSVPMDVVMLIDCSGSMRDKIQETREKAEAFMSELSKSGVDARIGGILYGTDIVDVLQPTSEYERFDEFLARAAATQADEYTPNALDELVGMKFRPEAERIGIVISDEVMYSNRNPALREVLTVRALWDKHISIMKIVKPCENNGSATAYLTLGREYDIAQPFNDILSRIGKESATLYAVTTEPVASSAAQFVGTVRDEKGNPVQAMITLTDAENAIIGPFCTNTNGIVRQAIMEGRKYQMLVRPVESTSLGASVSASAGIVVRTLDATRLTKGDTLRQDIMLPQRTVLRGIVRNEFGKPVQADIFLRDNLGYELPMCRTQRSPDGQASGDFEAVVMAGRKYVATIVPVASSLYEPLEREVDVRSFRAGDTLWQTFTLQKLEPFVLIEGVAHFDSVSSDLHRQGIQVTVKNQANQEVLTRTTADNGGKYSFRLPKGMSAEVIVEGGGRSPERWRAFFRKTDTTSVARNVSVLRYKSMDAEEEERKAQVSAALGGLRAALQNSSALPKRDALAAQKPLWAMTTVNDTVSSVALEAPIVPKREIRMPESSLISLSFADVKEVKPMVIDSSGAPLKRSWQEELDRIAKEIALDSGKLAKIVITGHADETASLEANRAEGWQRADFIVQELLKRGVPEALITATSLGNSQLLPRRAKESAKAYRARCRRVEMMKIWR